MAPAPRLRTLASRRIPLLLSDVVSAAGSSHPDRSPLLKLLLTRPLLFIGGKGGVGKSTVAVNLALALKRSGCQVGLMDADVYGPSVPHLLGVEGQPEVVDNRVQPIDAEGMPVMSIG